VKETQPENHVCLVADGCQREKRARSASVKTASIVEAMFADDESCSHESIPARALAALARKPSLFRHFEALSSVFTARRIDSGRGSLFIQGLAVKPVLKSLAALTNTKGARARALGSSPLQALALGALRA
jgi:hypothetical protein